MANPETPYVIAGTVAVVGGWAKHGGWPPNGTEAVAATVVLSLIAATTANTSVEPFVVAVGWLLVMGAVYAAVPALTTKKAGKK